MADPEQIAETYLATWNAAGETERSNHLARWAPDARYIDPLMRGEGREEIAAMMAAACAQFPGHRFAVTGQPDGHGDHIRFSWSLAGENGPPVAHGTDFVRLDSENRIAEVIGFLDPGAA